MLSAASIIRLNKKLCHIRLHVFTGKASGRGRIRFNFIIFYYLLFLVFPLP